MRSITFVLALAIAWGMQAGVSYAENDWWDHLSGPGPFVGVFATYRFVCLKNPTGNDVEVQRLSPFDRTGSFLAALKPSSSYEKVIGKYASEDDAKKQDCRTDAPVRGYLFFTYRQAWSIHNNLVAVTTDRAADRRVNVGGIDFGYLDRVSNSFDISLAVAQNHFWGAAFKGFSRPSVTALIEYSPLASLRNENAHLIKIMIGGTLWFKEFRAQQFCNASIARCVDPSWRSGPEFVPRIGFLYDWSEVR